MQKLTFFLTTDYLNFIFLVVLTQFLTARNNIARDFNLRSKTFNLFLFNAVLVTRKKNEKSVHFQCHVYFRKAVCCYILELFIGIVKTFRQILEEINLKALRITTAVFRLSFRKAIELLV